MLGYLRRAGVTKQVRVDELPSHFSKTGTPTMGGLMFVAPIAAVTAVLAFTWLRESGRSVILPMATMLVTAALGAYDDRLSLVGSRGGGISARAKFVALGGAALAAALALWHPELLGQVLLLPIIGLVYVAVTVSVIAQVGYFRLSSGKRLLRRAPLHRHFELMGWSQMQVAQRFWLISMITGLLGVALALK